MRSSSGEEPTSERKPPGLLQVGLRLGGLIVYCGSVMVIKIQSEPKEILHEKHQAL